MGLTTSKCIIKHCKDPQVPDIRPPTRRSKMPFSTVVTLPMARKWRQMTLQEPGTVTMCYEYTSVRVPENLSVPSGRWQSVGDYITKVCRRERKTNWRRLWRPFSRWQMEICGDPGWNMGIYCMSECGRIRSIRLETPSWVHAPVLGRTLKRFTLLAG